MMLKVSLKLRQMFIREGANTTKSKENTHKSEIVAEIIDAKAVRKLDLE